MSVVGKSLRASFVTIIFFGVALMSAGRVGYWQAYIYAGVSLLINLLTQIVLKDKPDLSIERSKPAQGSLGWDKFFLGIGFLLFIATLIVSGFDTGRYQWSPEFSWQWTILGGSLMLIGSGIFLYSMHENDFFSAVVRIQNDRGHQVCTTGPYRIVRHPGYLGMIIGTLGLPFVFLSVWSGIPVIASVGLLVARTYKEDRLLSAELQGYHEYQRTTQWKLIPGVW